MSNFYKCEVFDFTDIVEIDARSVIYLYNESGIYDGFTFSTLVGPYCYRHILRGNDNYRNITPINIDEIKKIMNKGE